ncbi:hypothetical protein M8C13_08670 [Crossiella sp. SN42]|uniref:hypothetical protein n=1 Tax=Crossiella sp. SN42 TaxID=2944808 RepID=UPI00207C43F6|nr:hypothetical protein [Crossiella sp. SN42]MCO1575828.1 hypothetical protein [Crossiella sp. SN42]
MTQRLGVWHERLKRGASKIPLARLYKGEHWVQTWELMRVAASAGFAPELWVASAGLGLQPVSSEFPAYAATFSPRHNDSVATSPVDRRLWWKGLQKQMSTPRVAELGGQRSVLLVLSDVYGAVLHPELHELARSSEDVLLVGGSEDVEGMRRLPANGALRSALGGTMTGLNARMAASWLARCSGGVLTADATCRSWASWAETVANPMRYNRVPQTDAQVKDFIRRKVVEHPGHSRSRLHRMLRDSGLACEQSRFAQLFLEVMGER